MKLRRFLPPALLCLGLVLEPARGQTADPDATPATRAVLDYIRHLSGRQDHRVLSGQFLNFAPNATLELPNRIHAASGKWPAYVGVDYMNFKDGGVIDFAAANRVALDYWRAGGLVEVNVHLPNPENPKGGGLRDTGVVLQDLLRQGSEPNRAWLRELDRVAEGLRQLSDSGVVVLWRPFHEMNGGWFWWGGKAPADMAALWRQTFSYLTVTKGLHNLIWIYSPNMGANAADDYPGDGAVDLVGLDAYTDDVDSAHISGFQELLRLGKPAGFGEYGPHGPSKPPGDFDYPRFAAGLSANFPAAVFFMSWNEKWSPALNPKAREFYNEPLLVTREDLPKSLFR